MHSSHALEFSDLCDLIEAIRCRALTLAGQVNVTLITPADSAKYRPARRKLAGSGYVVFLLTPAGKPKRYFDQLSFSVFLSQAFFPPTVTLSLNSLSSATPSNFLQADGYLAVLGAI